MTLMALTGRKEIRRAYDRFATSLREGAVRCTDTKVGYQGGGSIHDAYWRSAQGFWSAFDDAHSRYWCAFGATDPGDSRNLGITCEINCPFEGIDRRVAGVFVKNEDGNVFIAHSGKIGGGRKGVGKSIFWQEYRGGGPLTVRYPDDVEREVVVIASLDSPLLPAQVGHFVHEVARIKEAASIGASPSPGDLGSYTPEFSGVRTPYPLGGLVESTCTHGLVVDALAQHLRRRGYAIGNDRARDLFVVDDDGSVACLFEVKTDLSTTSTYAAIGQVMFHAALEDPTPVRVVVFPGTPTPEMAERIGGLGIEWLAYRLVEEVVRFKGLKRVRAKIDGATA